MSTFTREDIPVGQLLTGHHLTIPVFRFRGRGQGPKVYIQANVHGAELQGNAVIHALMEHLCDGNAPVGEIVLVPHANPYGGNQKFGDYTYGRFDPMSGHNWNRRYWLPVGQGQASGTNPCQVDLAAFVAQHRDTPEPALRAAFKQALTDALHARQREADEKGLDYSRRLCLTLQTLAAGADIVLDLHTAQRATRYLYAPEYAASSAAYFDIPHHILIPIDWDGAMDEASFIPWWQLRDALVEQGRPQWSVGFEAYTLELGSQETIDLKAAREDARGILCYLHHKGAVTTDPGPRRVTTYHTCFLKNYQVINTPHAGLIDMAAQPGKPIKEGELVGTVLSMGGLQEGRQPAEALHAITAPADGIPLTIFSSSAVHANTEIMGLMTQVETTHVSQATLS